MLVADIDLVRQCCQGLHLAVQIELLSQPQRLPAGHLGVLHQPLAQTAHPGQLNPVNAPYVLDCLAQAVAHCQSGRAAGLVTGPVHKGVINEAGIPFSGHTEHLAALAGVDQVVMMLAAGERRVALATTHLPLRAVPDAITRSGLTGTLRILDQALRQQFGLAQPRIAVLGLNPHAGESGHLGDEEIRIIMPVIEALVAEGLQLMGPWPADTAFVPERWQSCDAILAMYHDQGLPPLKQAGFGEAVNITLGLPFVRTSVDHGTALSLAGQGVARIDSLQAAVAQARRAQSAAP